MATDFAHWEEKIRQEFPRFQVVQKDDSRLMKAIDVFLKIITFWRMSRFMTSFITTFNQTMYVPKVWAKWPERERISILRHEAVHMRQEKKYGSLLWYFLYLFFPLPTVWAYYRMKFEREAYEESLRSYLYFYGGKVLDDWKLRTSVIDHFTTAEYFWMWPWRSSHEDWYDAMVERLRAENG